MARIVLPEKLDELPPQDLEALRSRRDLRRLNTWMGHPRVMARLLREHLPPAAPPNLVELGAGDGHFLLRVARRLQRQWPQGDATLVDRLDAVDPTAPAEFKRLGWRMHQEIAEAGEWLDRAAEPNCTVISNLFFHQFENAALTEMLGHAANRSRLVIALEPRRAWLPRFSSRLLWLIGCGPVTRYDAQVSVRAGFADGELSALWPDQQHWELREQRVGLFSHLFLARRKG